jgi:anti-sigma-K factor RskA
MNVVHENAAAYVLDALDPVERRDVERALADSEALRRDVAELQEVAALLAYAAPAVHPPPSLRARVLVQSRSGAVPNVHPARRVLPALTLAASLAGLLAVGALYTGERTSRRILALQTDSLRQEIAARDTVLEGLLGRDVATLRLASGEQRPNARMYWNRATGAVVLAAFQLQPAREGRAYQLWGIPSAGPPVSLGTFNTLATGEARFATRAPAGLTISVGAITEEPAGGSPQPTGSPLLSGGVN